MSDLRGNGTLIIVILKARNLPNRRKLDKQNPYCIARIANIVDRTPAITRGGQTPEWNHESRFQLTSEINPLLKLSVLDETKKSPVLIGDTEIDCTPVFSASSDEGYDKWHPLQYAGRAAGEVYVEMTFYPVTPVEPVRKKGAVTLHRNTVRPLPSRPDEEDGDVEEADRYEEDDYSTFSFQTRGKPQENDGMSFRTGTDSYGSYRPSLRHLLSQQSSYGSSRNSGFSDTASSYLTGSTHSGELFALNPVLQQSVDFNDSIAKQILREYPGKFEELLSRNPALAQSILHESRSEYDESLYDRASYRKSHSVSPVRNTPPGHERNLKSISASFDDLEKEVQTDWYRNNRDHPRYLQYKDSEARRPYRNPQHSRSMSPLRLSSELQIDPMRISSVLPKLPEFNRSKALWDEESRITNDVPSPPPHKSISSTPSRVSRYSRKPPPQEEEQQQSYSRKSTSPRRKPPPLSDSFNGRSSLQERLRALEEEVNGKKQPSTERHFGDEFSPKYSVASPNEAFKKTNHSSSFDPNASTFSDNWDIDSDEDYAEANNSRYSTGFDSQYAKFIGDHI